MVEILIELFILSALLFNTPAVPFVLMEFQNLKM